MSDDTEFHWRSRTIDQTGRASVWLSFGDNEEDVGDFATAVQEPPTVPTDLGQYMSDGVTVLTLADTTDSRTLVFKARVADPDPNDQVRLEVEVRPVGTAFNGQPMGSSVLAANRSIAAVTSPGSGAGTGRGNARKGPPVSKG